MANYFGDIWQARWLIEKGMALLYFVAFLSAFHQFPALLGERGLLPVKDFLAITNFKNRPSIFHWHYSDVFLKILTLSGMALALIIFVGLLDYVPLLVAILVWLVLWFLYLSIVNVGQTFYAFGWESMLLEAGFLASFLGNSHVTPSLIPMLTLRFMLFRTEFGAGLIKIRHDKCWRDLTCLFYHYETQPLPNPLSWFFHHLPRFVHRGSVLFSHFVQLFIPFFLFAPQPLASLASGFIIVHQFLLILSGNFSWLNWLTIVLGFSALSDSYIPGTFFHSSSTNAPIWYDILLVILAIFVIYLSFKPVANLFSKNQLMNFSYNPFHLINTYGAFGSITKKRYEIIIEGCADSYITADSKWKEYQFKAKPGLVNRWPPLVAPYHLRIDWLMWFLPFNVIVNNLGIRPRGYELWFIKLIQKLLDNDEKTISLLKKNPFEKTPPAYVRARFFHYEYTSTSELLKKKACWKRKFLGDYLAPISRKQLKI